MPPAESKGKKYDQKLIISKQLTAGDTLNRTVVFAHDIRTMKKIDSELREKIVSFHRRLNRRDIVPHGCYRRNSIHYRLVCYINNIIGLYLSSDFDTIPIFVNRAYKGIENRKKILENNGTEAPPYYNFGLEYLGLIAEFSNLLDTEHLKQGF